MTTGVEPCLGQIQNGLSTRTPSFGGEKAPAKESMEDLPNAKEAFGLQH